MKMVKKRRFESLFLVLLVLLICPMISSVGLSKVYYSDNPVLINPGETKEIVFATLMANEEESDRSLEFELIEGSEIASLVTESMIVPAGSTNETLDISISIPKDIDVGTEYLIKIKVKDVTAPEGEGMVGFTDSKTSSIPVIVQIIEKESEKGNGMGMIIGIIVLLIIVIAVAIILLKSKKEQSKQVPLIN